MCISSGESEMTKTRIYAGETMRNGKLHHVLAYQNNAENLSNGVNAMILPVPAVGELNEQNLVDVTKFSDILKDMEELMKPRRRGMTKSLGDDDIIFGAAAGFSNLMKIGSYDVAAGSSMPNALKALAKLPAEKRPKISVGLLSTMSSMYKNWAFAICCWDGQIEAEPLVFVYEPMFPEKLFAPALDAHDGNAPKNQRVRRDHSIMFGSTIKDIGEYTNFALRTEAKLLFASNYAGFITSAITQNGDYWRSTEPESNVDLVFPT